MISGAVLILNLALSAAPSSPAQTVLAQTAAAPMSSATSAAPGPDASAAGDANALIATLKRAAPADTNYAEIDFVHVLKAPLQLRGVLYYGGPASLSKSVTAPYRETTVIENGEVTVTREGKSARHFSLERAPELGGLLSGFSALLGGDAASLQKTFAVTLDRSQPNWRIVLTPRSNALAKRLRAMTVDGHAGNPVCFTLSQADGDANVMLLGALSVVLFRATPTATALDALCRGAP